MKRDESNLSDFTGSQFTDRRSFIRSVGLASLGIAAAGRPANTGDAKTDSNRIEPLLDPEAPLRIGMIGTTGHTNLVLGFINRVDDAQIVAYAFEDGDWSYNEDGSRRDESPYDLDTKRRWVSARSWSNNDTGVYETYQEMLDREQLDLVVVCLPYARNAYAATAAAQRGLHVLCEKPVAVNEADLVMVERAVKENDVRLSAMFNMRYDPHFFTIKQAVIDGRIGIPCLGRAQKSYKWGAGRPWFYKYPDIYGSSILWVGIHAVDYIRWTMGLEVSQVSAIHGNIAHPDYPGAQDHGVINMRMENGATAAVTIDYLRPAKARTHGDDRLRIAGTEGIIEKNAGESVELVRNDSAPTDLALLEPSTLFEDFIGELRGHGRHLIGPEEAIRVTRICIAATRAAEEGRVLDL